MRYSILAVLAAIAAMLGVAGAHAQGETAAAPACESDENFEAFDFWLGSWDVYVEDRKAGENTITKEEGGCLVLEKWTDAAGGTGQSYNFYNPATGQWRQVWVSSYMTIDYAGGLTEDGSMQLIGTITYFHNQKSLDFLGRWTKQEDGSVRQYFEQYDEESGEMKPIFTGIYRRKT